MRKIGYADRKLNRLQSHPEHKIYPVRCMTVNFFYSSYLDYCGNGEEFN